MANFPQETRRPSPEALLAEAKKEGRGKLKIFLGAAPGVGKTYTMLEDAHALMTEGIDVMIGVVETHGRKETQSRLRDIPVIPRKIIEYRDKTFEEMDLDAILARRPAIVLVDELAHTNVEGSRHPKRYQDVEEILEAGIDVFSTINIQHIESLNDTVTRISGVQVKETVPDRILNMADDIELIDIPPKELQKRLNEGKVYVPEQAQRAINHFFSQSNLTALREMSLRFAAERVDKQMLQLMQVQGVETTWPTRERLLLCVGNDYGALELVRSCSQTADQWKAPWIALHVDTTKETMVSSDTDYASKALQLAEELNGEAVTLAGNDIIKEVLEFARSRNITRIIIGKSRKKFWNRFIGGGLSNRLCDRNDTFKIVVVPTEDIVVAERRENNKTFTGFGSVINYLIATAACAVASGLAYVAQSTLHMYNLSLIFLLAVIFVAIRYGLLPSLYTIVLSFVIYNFFFLEPHFSFALGQKEHMITLGMFVIVATAISRLTSQIHNHVEIVKQNALRTSNLYSFSQRVSVSNDINEVTQAAVFHITEVTDQRAVLMMPTEGKLEVKAGFPHLDDVSRGAADWAWKKNEPAGYLTSTLPGSTWFFMPLSTDNSMIGVLGIEFAERDQAVSSSQRKLFEALAHQTAMAIERCQFLDDLQKNKLSAETERLRSAMLSSISHDFRTPLSSIIGGISSLQKYGPTIDEKTRQDLQDSIYQEAERLNRFIQNLLDMTRHESGKLTLNYDWVEASDIVSSALSRIHKTVGHRKVSTLLQLNLPLLYVDPVLIEQVVVNLLDNACNYSADGTQIWIMVHRVMEHFTIEVVDEGRGIPEEEREHIFDMFYRINAADKQSAGTGLGLSICRGIITAHGGNITSDVGNNGIGTKITVVLPYHKEPVVNETDA